MEREQILNAYEDGYFADRIKSVDELNVYYDETYGKNDWYNQMRGDKLSPQKNVLSLHGQAKRLPKLLYYIAN